MLIKKFFGENKYWSYGSTTAIEVDHTATIYEGFDQVKNKELSALTTDGYLLITPLQSDLKLLHVEVDKASNLDTKVFEWIKKQKTEDRYHLFMEYTMLYCLNSGRYNELFEKIILSKMDVLRELSKDTLKIMDSYNISKNLINKLENATYVVPLVLFDLQGYLVYILFTFTPISSSKNCEGTVKPYIGIGNSGITLPKFNVTLEQFREILREYCSDSWHMYHSGYVPIISMKDQFGTATIPVFRALTGQIPCNVIQRPKQNLYTWLVSTLKSMDSLNQLSCLNTSQHFAEFINELVPDTLIEKVKLGKNLDIEEEQNLAIFLDVSAVVLQKYEEPGLYLSTLYKADTNIMSFVKELTKDDLRSASELPKEVVKRADLSETEVMVTRGGQRRTKYVVRDDRADLISVISHRNRIYVVGKKERTLWGLTLNGVDLAPIKEKVLNRYYKYQ